MNLVAGLYPGLYDWLQEVPVTPGIPPGTCVTSEVKAQCSVTAAIDCTLLVTSDCLRVTYPVTPVPELPVLVMVCEIEVLQAVECETLDCRCLVTSQECVEVRQLEDEVVQPVNVCAEVRVQCLVEAGIAIRSLSNKTVTAGISVRAKVEASIACCCMEMKS